MEQKEIIEGNKLIAEFMGKRKMAPIDQKYHSDWNWIMPVVEKIESLFNNSIIFYIKDCRAYIECDTQIGLVYEDLPDVPECYSGFCEKKIESVYNTVLQFIQFYNTLNK